MGRVLPFLILMYALHFNEGWAINLAESNSFNFSNLEISDFQDVPPCTNLVVPINGQNDVPLDTDLSWNTIPEATGYRITVGRTSGGSEILDNLDVGDVTTFDFETDFAPGETIYVTIVPYNSAGNSTGCPEESFTTQTSQVGLPVCSLVHTPMHESYGIPPDAEIFWYSVTGATGYRLTVGTSPGGNDVLDDVDMGNNLSYDFNTAFTEGTVIYTKVEPYNEAGTAIGCSQQNYRIAFTERPECSSLTDEFLTGEDIPIDTGLSWNAAERAVGYRIAVGTSPSSSDILDNLLVEGATDYKFTSDLPTNTTIYVSIIPYNSLGDALNCTQQSFNTQPLLPDCSFLITPFSVNGVIDVSTNINWTPSSNAEGYRISVRAEPSGLNELDDIDLGNTTTYEFDDFFQDGDTVYVTVVPYNSTGEAIGCEESSFTVSTANLLAECSGLITPSNNATDVPVDINLNWNSVENADGYFLRVGTFPGGGDLVNSQDVGLLTTFQFASNLPYASPIFVSVIPYNQYGTTEGCQSTFTTIPRISNKTSSVEGFSPNGDGVNDFWLIEGIEQYPQNTVVIYNRWGNQVFQIEGYNNFDRVFFGEANQMTKMGAGTLPEGTYFFEILTNAEEVTFQKRGALLIKR